MDIDPDIETQHDSPTFNVVRSCGTCSKAKAKCVKKPGAEICERCARLKKECFLKESVLRKKKIIKTTRAAQFEKLESKLESLVNALSSNPQAANQYGQLSPPVSQDSGDRGVGRSKAIIQSMCPNSNEDPQPADTLRLSLPETNPSSKPTCDSSFLNNIPTQDANILLDRWRRLMAPGFPFVVVPKDATAMSLAQSKPVLLRAIITVAYFHDLPRQQVMVKELVREMADRIMMKNEKSLDILQGILVFVAWYHIHIFWSHQASNLLHLAMSIVVDLNLDRPASHGSAIRKVASAHDAHHPKGRIPTSDEYRTLLGLFYLTSMLASAFNKIVAMKYTKYVDECLASIEQNHEHESDLLLARMVHVQRVMDQIHMTDPRSAPVNLYIKAFKADLDKLRTTDPIINHSIYLQLNYLIAEVVMWELSLKDLQEGVRSNPTTSTSTPGTSLPTPHSHRITPRPLTDYLADLVALLSTIKSFFDVFFTLPPENYLLLPFSVFGHFAHAFIVLTKLAVLEVEGWDLSSLSAQLNFSHIIDACDARFTDTGRVFPEGVGRVNNETFVKFTQRLRWMKTVYEARQSASGGPQGVAGVGGGMGANLGNSASAAAAAAAAAASMAAMAGMGGGLSQTGSERERPALSSGSSRTGPSPASVSATPSLKSPEQMYTWGEDGLLSADFFNYMDESVWNGLVADVDLTFPEGLV